MTILMRSSVFLYDLIILILILSYAATQDSILNSFDSPCPNIFKYAFKNNNLYGIIKIESPGKNFVKLDIEMSIGNKVEEFDNGRIEMVKSPEGPISDVMDRKPLFYDLYFPKWINIPPKITNILVNGELICSGPKITMTRIRTTIRLSHTLKINVQTLSVSPNSFSTNPNNIPFDDDDEPPSRKIYNDRPYGRGPQPDRSGNQFNFQPPPSAPPKRDAPIKNIFNFYPAQPSDPSKIYPGNPFFDIILASTNPPSPIADEDDKGNHFTLPSVPKNPFVIPTTERTVVFRPPSASKPPQPNLDQFNPVDEPLPNRPSDKEVELVSKDRTDRPYDNVCGQAITTNSLIINGNTVPMGAFPWLVALFQLDSERITLKFICSGSLISDRHIVTAGHCVREGSITANAKELLVTLGESNLRKWESSNAKRIIVKTVNVHESYDSHNSDADIAVLELTEPVAFTMYIRPLCLWSGSTDLENVVGYPGTVVGWGKTETELSSAEPRFTTLPIVNQEQCLRSSFGYQYITSNRTFCAGFRNGSGPCNGDSGSGFLLQEDGRWVLRGVVSRSLSKETFRSCDLKNYVVFTDASKHLDWLMSFIK